MFQEVDAPQQNGERPLPYSEDCEKGVLCSLILDPASAGETCSRLLTPEYFWAPAHKIIYKVLSTWKGVGAVEFPWLVEEVKNLGLLEEVGGREFLVELMNFVPTASNVGYYLDGMRETWQKREAIILGRRLSQGGELHELIETLQKINSLGANQQWLGFVGVEELPKDEPQLIIDGLLRVAEKLGITAGSKQFKSWCLLHLAFCIANGLPWLGRKTTKQKVALFDLELSAWGLRKRLETIRKSVGKGDFQNLRICPLRGKARQFCANLEKVQRLIISEEIKVAVIDPAYKFLLGQNESDNALVAEVLDRLTVFCMEAKVALIYVHHHSKGNQAGKDSLDRSSGAGSWSRDPDAVLDFSEQKESEKDERIYVAEITVREFPPIPKFVVRWNYPLLEPDLEGLDPDQLKEHKKSGAGRPPGDANALILASLRSAEGLAGLTGLTAKQIAMVTELNLRTIQRHLKSMLGTKVAKCVPIDGYQLSVSELSKFKSQEKP
jgi:hypothetical protein